MAYAAFSDVITRYRPLSTMVGTGAYDVTSLEVSSVFIWQSEAYVDAYLARRYSVPMTAPISPLITQVTADLAIFAMLAEKLPSVPEFIDKRRERAEGILGMIADGKLTITSASTVSSQGDNFAWSATMGHHPIFSPVINELDQIADIDRVEADRWDRGYDTRSY
jgi:phage gp36-like protein